MEGNQSPQRRVVDLGGILSEVPDVNTGGRPVA
jgi:hypothetical protein